MYQFARKESRPISIEGTGDTVTKGFFRRRRGNSVDEYDLSSPATTRIDYKDNNSPELLLRKIGSRAAHVVVFGLGYVGLPLLSLVAERGFSGTGVDTDGSKVQAIQNGSLHIAKLYAVDKMPALVREGKITATTDGASATDKSDIVVICVPTPLTSDKVPDLTYLEHTCQSISAGLGVGKLVILESSVYPGVTESIVKPLLEAGGLRASKDFWLAHSPERIDYGNRTYRTKDIPKVVGGLDSCSTDLAAKFYELVLDALVVRVSTAKAAESVKMLENVYRYVNIALVNELAILHERMGVDFTEVVHAAATKPFGFQPHYPGPGVGGHCIPKDPFYLLYAAKLYRTDLKLVRASEEINESMPLHIVTRLKEILVRTGRSLGKARVAVLGLSYKANTGEARNSPAIPVIRLLRAAGAEVVVHDPLIHSIDIDGNRITSVNEVGTAVSSADCLIVLTDHDEYKSVDWRHVCRVMKSEPVLLDARNMLDRRECEHAGFIYLGIGRQ